MKVISGVQFSVLKSMIVYYGDYDTFSIVFLFYPTCSLMVGWLLCLCRIAEHNRPNLLGLACQYVCVGGLIFREDSPKDLYLKKFLFFGYYWIIVIVSISVAKGQGLIIIL